MKPLITWFCDSCGELVKPTGGTVIARYTPDEERRPTGFLIVHKNIDGRECDPGSRNGYYYNVDLDGLIGQRGMAHLLAHLSAGPLKGGGGTQIVDMDEFVDLFRRLQVPFYEQARRRFGDKEVVRGYSDANEYLPYMPTELEAIAKKAHPA